MPTDQTIVRAAIHPAIGVARVGNSREDDGYFLAPEVPHEPALPTGHYKDRFGALKRQAARFRIYGLNAAGEVVKEITADDGTILWTVHLANKKAAWYEFQLALDIAEASAPSTPPSARRNAHVVGDERQKLVIDPGARSISGRNFQDSSYRFDTGRFHHLVVPLGELRTDDKGRLLVFGGSGLSQSLTGAPPATFANNDDWHDDTSDGPVDAKLHLGGREIPVDGAWVVVGPPNYAPAIKTPRTLYDLLYDRMTAWGFAPAPSSVSFQRDIRPVFDRLASLQWVNLGFASWFGAGAPFSVDALLPRLADSSDANGEFRRRIYQQFRNPFSAPAQLGAALWPQFYGDALDSLSRITPQNPDSSMTVPHGLASLSEAQLEALRQWSLGNFNSDPPATPVQSLADAPPADQTALLDEAALSFCLADAFHPGCELTWTMRIRHLYSGHFRIKRRTTQPDTDYGSVLTPAIAISAGGPLDGAAAGDLSKWMAVPWQTDTASCLSGYSFFSTSPSLPTFWPARVPNDVLREVDYKVLMNPGESPEVRLQAFHRRLDWFRIFPGDGLNDIARMIAEFHQLGIIEERGGPTDLPGVPQNMWVESKPGLPEPHDDIAGAAANADVPSPAFGGKRLRRIGDYGQTVK